ILKMEERVAQLLIVDSMSDDLLSSIKKADLPKPGFIFSHENEFNSFKRFNNPLVSFNIFDVREGFDRKNSKVAFPNENLLSLIDDSLYGDYKSIYYKYLNQSNGFLTGCSWTNQVLAVSNKNKQSDFQPFVKIWLPTDTLSSQQLDIFPTPQQFLRLKSQQLHPINANRTYRGMISSFTKNFDLQISEPSVEVLLKPDHLFYSTDYKKELLFLSNGFKNRWLPIELLENACKAVLAAKYESVTRSFKEIEKVNYVNEEVVLRSIYENSVAVIQKQKHSPLPLTSLNLKIRIYNDAFSEYDGFIKMANNYYDLQDTLGEKYDLLLWLTSEESHFSSDIEAQIRNLKVNNKVEKVMMVWAGNLKMLPFTQLPEELDVLVLTPSITKFSSEILAQTIFNGIKVTSKSESSALTPDLRRHSIAMPTTRLKYGIAQEVGMSEDSLRKIDSIIEKALKEKATPGAQLLIARKGVVVYQKSFGYQTYDKKEEVNNQKLYDLASISKIASTLPILMHLYDQGAYKLNDRLADYLPESDSTDKADIKIRALLLHESGLLSYIPFYQSTIDTARLDGFLFSRKKSLKYSIRMEDRLYMNNTVAYRKDLYQPLNTEDFSLQVAQGVYLNKSYKDSMMTRILNSTLRKKEYLYSDLNFLLLENIVNKITLLSLDTLSYNWFYQSMGANRLRYNPLRFFKLKEVVPTEIDNYFRRQLIRGYVHDQGAAMMGGVAGHAGLFGNANDLAKMMQMYLNFGEYGGQRYLNSETVRLFIARQNSDNRRGLGFDKPETNLDKIGPTGKLVSPLSFGHTGFTGTIAWADPAFDLIYIFLSNRTFPNGYNNKLGEMNVRTKIQDAIYKSIIYE
ncbi:MAG TPA: serine hydrolase, partial [Marinilabiliaceae bacterium]|nr:serine hydrolase [Marinilabiliaceae bacterium]